MTPNLLWHIKLHGSISLKHLDLIQMLPGFENDRKTQVRQGQLRITHLIIPLS